MFRQYILNHLLCDNVYIFDCVHIEPAPEWARVEPIKVSINRVPISLSLSQGVWTIRQEAATSGCPNVPIRPSPDPLVFPRERQLSNIQSHTHARTHIHSFTHLIMATCGSLRNSRQLRLALWDNRHPIRRVSGVNKRIRGRGGWVSGVGWGWGWGVDGVGAVYAFFYINIYLFIEVFRHAYSRLLFTSLTHSVVVGRWSEDQQCGRRNKQLTGRSYVEPLWVCNILCHYIKQLRSYIRRYEAWAI